MDNKPNKRWNWDGVKALIEKENVDKPWTWNSRLPVWRDLKGNAHMGNIQIDLITKNKPWTWSDHSAYEFSDKVEKDEEKQKQCPDNLEEILKLYSHSSDSFYIAIRELYDIPSNLDFWFVLSQQLGITFEMVQNHPEIPWNWTGLTINPNITTEIIKANPDRPWSANYLRYHA